MIVHVDLNKINVLKPPISFNLFLGDCNPCQKVRDSGSAIFVGMKHVEATNQPGPICCAVNPAQ